MARDRCYEPLRDIHPLTGATIEVFYADRALETFGRLGAGCLVLSAPRLLGIGSGNWSFRTSYAAYRDAMRSLSDHDGWHAGTVRWEGVEETTFPPSKDL